LLLLDEPAAHLDAAAEQRLLAAVLQAGAGRSLVLITHRLVAMETMDEILVLRTGSVIERGTHAELLVAGGEYAQLWKIQCETLS
jgi:ABC-type multidrug transport system fused ATPase/permease subunit